jgi:hypothetical protein
MTGEEITNAEDYLAMATYLTQVYDSFRCEIPHIKHPKLELPEPKKSDTSFKSVKHHHQQLQHQVPQVVQPSVPRPSSRHKRHAEPPVLNKASSIDRKTRKRRTLEKIGASVVSITLLALIWASLLFGLDTRCYIILTVLLFIIFFIL